MSDSAFSTSMHSSKPAKKFFKKEFKCYRCHRVGHKAADCGLNKKMGKRSSEKTLMVGLETNSDDDWYIDSGATTHMTKRKDWLQNYCEIVPKNIKVANNENLAAEGKGDIELRINNSGEEDVITISNAIHVPGISNNLLSVSRSVQRNLVLVFSKRGCEIYHEDNILVKGTTMATASDIGGMYRLDRAIEQANSAVTNVSHMTWHKRLGHLNRKGMQLLESGMATGITLTGNEQENCISCIKGKQTRQPFKTAATHRATEMLELVHSDICGPMSTNSWGNGRYLLTFIDDKTRKIFGYILKSKTEVATKFEEFKALVENQTSKRIKALRTDNGTEYVNEHLKKCLSENGIRHETTVPYCPEQNGVAERANRTIVERARSMLIEANLSKEYWAEAVMTSIYLTNRSPTKSVKAMTPEESWTGRKVDLSHLRIFGCKGFAHIPKELRRKWDSKSKELIHVGYCENTKGYRLIDPNTPWKIIKARDVMFIEQSINCEEKGLEKVTTEDALPLLTSHKLIQSNVSEQGAAKVQDLQVEEIDQTTEKPERRYPERNRQPPQFYHDMYGLKAFFVREMDPETVEEAMNRADSYNWRIAMENEYDSLMKNDAWTLVELPENKKLVDSKWIFKTKETAQGEVERYKARFVAKGYSQQPGIDYDLTFSPVLRQSSLRLLLALAVEMDFDIDHMDVTTAFLYGTLEEEVYIKQPQGFEKKGEEEKVCLLKKALYGLKQASRSWYQKLDTTLAEIGFTRSDLDPCIYFQFSNGLYTIVAVYVDDLLIFSNDCSKRDLLKEELMNRFCMRDLGELCWCLGMRISRNREKGELTVDQQKYVVQVLMKFNMIDCNSISTPLDPKQQLRKGGELEETDAEEMKMVPYQQAVGSLLYAAQSTRPDISFAVGAVSRFNSDPRWAHWLAVKRILRYLKGTTNLGLKYKRTGNLKVVGFCDADWGSNPDDRRSVTGYVFIMAEGAISWMSKKQTTVALSTTEAEYMALASAAQEALYLRGLLCELNLFPEQELISLHCDNRGATDLSMSNAYHSRTKHIDIRHHFVREIVQKKQIEVKSIGTKDQIADNLTKGVSAEKHHFCNEKLGLNTVQDIFRNQASQNSRGVGIVHQ